MQRIGLTASKIAKGNIWLYHLAVVVISCLFAMFTFLVCGFVIAIAILVVSLLLQHVIPSVNQQTWLGVMLTCLYLLAALIGVMTIVAIIKNIKLKNKI